MRSKRITAQILDTVINFGILTVFTLVLFLVIRALDLETKVFFPIQFIVSVLIFMVFNVYMLNKYRATIGYKIVGLKIVYKDKERETLKWDILRIFLRLVYYSLSASTVLVVYHYIKVYISNGEEDPIDQLLKSSAVTS